MKLYPVLHCGQVLLPRDNHVFRGGPQSKYLFSYSAQEARSKIFLTCCIKHGKYKGLQTLVSEKVPHWS